MKHAKYIAAAAIVIFAAVAGLSQNPPAPVFAPSIWGVHISSTGNFGDQARSDNVVASFTPARNTQITRVEVEVAFGPARFEFASFPPHYAACEKNQSITVTDGTTVYTLELNPPVFNAFGNPAGSSTDSGVIDVVFPAGSKIKVVLTPGDIAGSTHSECSLSDANVTIQYR